MRPSLGRARGGCYLHHQVRMVDHPNSSKTLKTLKLEFSSMYHYSHIYIKAKTLKLKSQFIILKSPQTTLNHATSDFLFGRQFENP